MPITTYTHAGHWGPEVPVLPAQPLATLPGRSIMVRDTSGFVATLYTDRTKGTTAANPVLIDGDGNLSIFAVPGEYDAHLVTNTVEGPALRISVPIDPVDAATDPDLAALQAQVDAIVAVEASGTFASRPAAGTAGHIYYATDQGITYRDLGASWLRLNGNPKDIWVTDYGWLCDNNTASASANVTAYNAALAAARAAAGTSTGGHKTIFIPEAPGFTTAYVNDTLNYEFVDVVGVGGSQRPSFSYGNCVKVQSVGVAMTTKPVFSVDRSVAGVHGGRLKDLYVVGYNQAFNIKNSSNVEWDNVHGDISNTGLTRNHTLVIENSFLLNLRDFALHTGGDTTLFSIGIYATDGGPIGGIAESYFRNGTLDYGPIYFESQVTTVATPSTYVSFENVITENQNGTTFLKVRSTASGAGSHGLDQWRFINAAVFDNTGSVSAFFDFDGDNRMNFIRFKIVGGAPTTYMIKSLNQTSLGGWEIDSLSSTQTLFDPASSTTNVYGMKVADQYGHGHSVRGNMTANANAAQWSVGISDSGYRVGKAIGDTHSRGMWRASDGALSMGSGSAVHDTYLRRSAASTVTVDSDGAGGTATLITGALAATSSIRAGTNPASAGVVRIPNDGRISARNVANSADIDILYLSTGNTTILTGAAMSLLSSGSINLAPGNVTKFSVNASNLTLADAYDIVFNATTGTKIGTANTQKLALWGATPIVQPVMATGAGHTVDDLITMLQSEGLCRQS